MVPRKSVPSLAEQSLNEIVGLLQNILYQETSHYYVHDDKTNQVDSVDFLFQLSINIKRVLVFKFLKIIALLQSQF